MLELQKKLQKRLFSKYTTILKTLKPYCWVLILLSLLRLFYIFAMTTRIQCGLLTKGPKKSIFENSTNIKVKKVAKQNGRCVKRKRKTEHNY